MDLRTLPQKKTIGWATREIQRHLQIKYSESLMRKNKKHTTQMQNIRKIPITTQGNLASSKMQKRGNSDQTRIQFRHNQKQRKSLPMGLRFCGLV